ncbi:MAG: hypothetical protein GF344_06230 [Chitinivibrionales bacterium]|nr:hypothetical protein [Chitinivibrionales bacterium]MBD3356530.1 hypothetical protein [Chitinivibrionales bacterium]
MAASEDGTKVQHERLVRHAAEMMKGKGFSQVQTNLAESARPPSPIHWERDGSGHVPDITGVRGGRRHIWEVETAGTLGSHEVVERLKLFATYADRNRCTFSLIIPGPCREEAVRRLAECGVFAGIIELPVDTANEPSA